MTDTTAFTGNAAGTGAGITIDRVYTTEGVHPYDQVTWDYRDVVQTNWKNGEVIFEQRGVEFPEFWSINASLLTGAAGAASIAMVIVSSSAPGIDFSSSGSLRPSRPHCCATAAHGAAACPAGQLQQLRQRMSQHGAGLQGGRRGGQWRVGHWRRECTQCRRLGWSRRWRRRCQYRRRWRWRQLVKY
jgi:hypothetical protein